MALLCVKGAVVLCFCIFRHFWYFLAQGKQTSGKESQQGGAGTGRCTNGNGNQTNRNQAHNKEIQYTQKASKEKAKRRRRTKVEGARKKKNRASVGNRKAQ